MKNYIKKVAAVAMVAGTALTLAACSNSGNNAVVTYKGGKITQDQYYNEMKKSQAGKQTLAQLIINDALKAQYGDKVSDKQVDNQFNNYKKQYGAQFDAMLQQNGMTPSSFKQNIRTNLLTQAALKSIKKISSSQEEAAWKNYQPKVQVQHILVDNQSTANKIIKELKAGKSFASLAKKYSLDTATKNNAGKLPAFDSTDTTLDKSFKAAAFKLKNGEVTETPVKSQSGYHVIKMIDHPAKGKFADHKKAIDDSIYAQMAQDQGIMKEVISTVLKRADVTIKDQDLKDVLTPYLSTSAITSNK